MKKFGLFIVGLIALFLLLANVGPLISLAICLAILYFGFKQFMKSESTGAKIAWGITLHYCADRCYFSYPSNIGTGSSLCSLPRL